MWFALQMMLRLLRVSGRARQDLVLENLVLRHQLAVLERRGRRPALRDADRRLWSLIAHEWHGWRDHVHIVQPATVVRWHRTAWRRYWSWRSRGGRPGRPRIAIEARAALTQIVQQNPRWGVQRIVGELRALGFAVSATTVRRYRARIPRPPSPTWRTFLRLHAGEIWAADFFTVQTLTFKTVYVFLVISHDRRRLVYWNVTAHPNKAWVWRQVIAATPWNVGPRFLIRDRDRAYGADFVARARRIGIETILTPVRAPQANAIAERVIRTIRQECLDHVIVLNEQHLRRLLAEFVPYYNRSRPHRSLDLEPPDGSRVRVRPPAARLTSRPVLGGLHHVYEWAA
jgi:transposase InsO family protein